MGDTLPQTGLEVVNEQKELQMRQCVGDTPPRTRARGCKSGMENKEKKMRMRRCVGDTPPQTWLEVINKEKKHRIRQCVGNTPPWTGLETVNEGKEQGGVWVIHRLGWGSRLYEWGWGMQNEERNQKKGEGSVPH